MGLENNDTQSAMMYLDMALSAMGRAGGGTQGNINSSTAGGGNATQAARKAYLLVEQVRLTTMMRQQTTMDRIIVEYW
jgi:hypothetical protein